MAIVRKLAYNVVFNSVLKAVSTVVLSLFLVRLITGYLGQDGFGKYATVLAFFSFFSAIGDLGLGPVTAREIAKEGANERKILGNVVGLRLLSSLLLILLAPAIILFFDYSVEVKWGILIVACASLFSSLSLVMNSIFQKRIAMDRVAMVEFIGKLIQVSLIALIVRFDLGFLPIVVSVLVALSFNIVTVFLVSRKFVRFFPQFDFVFWRNFLKESLPMGATALITFAYFKTDTILLSLFQTSAAVGIYNVAYKIIENLVFFPAMLAGLVLPLLARYFMADRKKFLEIANKTFKVFVIIVLPLVLGTVFLAKDIVFIISGPEFAASIPVLRILAFSLACIFFGHFFNMILIVAHLQKKLMQALLFVAVFNISFNLFVVSRYSYFGAATAAVLTEGLVVVLTSFLVYRNVGFLPRFTGMGSVMLSAFGMALALYFLSSAPFLLAGSLSLVVYLSLLWITRAISSDEVASLFSKGDDGLAEVPAVH
jgi:O-antigen/teichoic acid export membrane protein